MIYCPVRFEFGGSHYRSRLDEELRSFPLIVVESCCGRGDEFEDVA